MAGTSSSFSASSKRSFRSRIHSYISPEKRTVMSVCGLTVLSFASRISFIIPPSCFELTHYYCAVGTLTQDGGHSQWAGRERDGREGFSDDLLRPRTG